MENTDTLRNDDLLKEQENDKDTNVDAKIKKNHKLKCNELALIMSYFNFQSNLKIRLVCRTWNEVANRSLKVNFLCPLEGIILKHQGKDFGNGRLAIIKKKDEINREIRLRLTNINTQDINVFKHIIQPDTPTMVIGCFFAYFFENSSYEDQQDSWNAFNQSIISKAFVVRFLYTDFFQMEDIKIARLQKFVEYDIIDFVDSLSAFNDSFCVQLINAFKQLNQYMRVSTDVFADYYEYYEAKHQASKLQKALKIIGIN